ncbi:hypothetical protein ACO0QE_003798 [Hanseniaspora vineae]
MSGTLIDSPEFVASTEPLKETNDENLSINQRRRRKSAKNKPRRPSRNSVSSTDSLPRYNNGNSTPYHQGQYHPLTPLQLNMNQSNFPNQPFHFQEPQHHYQPLFQSPRQKSGLGLTLGHSSPYLHSHFNGSGILHPAEHPSTGGVMASPFDPHYGTFLIPSNLITPYSATSNKPTFSYFDFPGSEPGSAYPYSQNRNESSHLQLVETAQNLEFERGGEKNKYKESGQDNDTFNDILEQRPLETHPVHLLDTSHSNYNKTLRNKFKNQISGSAEKSSQSGYSSSGTIVESPSSVNTSKHNDSIALSEPSTRVQKAFESLSVSSNSDSWPNITFHYRLNSDVYPSSELTNKIPGLLIQKVNENLNLSALLQEESLLYSTNLTGAFQEIPPENASLTKNIILTFENELTALKYHNKLLKTLNILKAKTKSPDLFVENCIGQIFVNKFPLKSVKSSRFLMVKLLGESNSKHGFEKFVENVMQKISQKAMVLLKIDVFDCFTDIADNFMLLTFATPSMKYNFIKLFELDPIRLFEVSFLSGSANETITEEQLFQNVKRTETRLSSKKSSKEADSFKLQNGIHSFSISSDDYPKPLLEHHEKLSFKDFKTLSEIRSEDSNLLKIAQRKQPVAKKGLKLVTNMSGGFLSGKDSDASETELASPTQTSVSFKSQGGIDGLVDTPLPTGNRDQESNLIIFAPTDLEEEETSTMHIYPEDTFERDLPLQQKPNDVFPANPLISGTPRTNSYVSDSGGNYQNSFRHTSSVIDFPMPPPMPMVNGQISAPHMTPQFRTSIFHNNQPPVVNYPSYSYTDNYYEMLRLNYKNRVIFISNIPKNCKIEDICNVVRGGIVQKIKYLKEKNYCFITFVDPSSAAKFFEFVNCFDHRIILHGNELDIKFGSKGLKLPPIPNKLLLSLSLGACRNIYISLPEFSYKHKYITDPQYEQFQHKYFLPDEKTIRRDFSQKFGELEKINYINDGHCCWVNFLDIGAAITFMESLVKTPRDFHAAFDNRYLGLVIKYGKDRCANNFKVVS